MVEEFSLLFTINLINAQSSRLQVVACKLNSLLRPLFKFLA